MSLPVISPKAIVRGPFLPEPVEVIITVPMGDSLKLVGRGIKTNASYDPVLSPAQLAELEISPEREPLDGDPERFRLGIEAARLALAYEYDPFFSLSVARIDPLPHQLEAIYEYFMKLPRIRFLLADDPGAGKTIMAGLLLKELKARGLVKLKVRFEVTEGVSSQKADETKVALRELGLDEGGLQVVEGK